MTEANQSSPEGKSSKGTGPITSLIGIKHVDGAKYTPWEIKSLMEAKMRKMCKNKEISE